MKNTIGAMWLFFGLVCMFSSAIFDSDVLITACFICISTSQILIFMPGDKQEIGE